MEKEKGKKSKEISIIISVVCTVNEVTWKPRQRNMVMSDLFSIR